MMSCTLFMIFMETQDFCPILWVIQITTLGIPQITFDLSEIIQSQLVGLFWENNVVISQI